MDTENNKLLADFMGWSKFNEFSAISPNSLDDCWQYEDMKFNSDWNWLMQVVEKIWSMQGENVGAQVTICNSGCLLGYRSKTTSLEFNCHKYTFLGSKGMYTKEHTYNVCVEFVKWYNNQNKL